MLLQLSVRILPSISNWSMEITLMGQRNDGLGRDLASLLSCKFGESSRADL